jgi:hypothetical protein
MAAPLSPVDHLTVRPVCALQLQASTAGACSIRTSLWRHSQWRTAERDPSSWNLDATIAHSTRHPVYSNWLAYF